MCALLTFLVSYTFHILFIYLAICIIWGWDSVFSVAMCYELDGLAFETWWGKRFIVLQSCRDRPWAHAASCTVGTGDPHCG